MNFKSLNKKIALLSATLISAASFSGISSTVNAESAAAKSSNGGVTIYAQRAKPLSPEDNILGSNDGSALTSGLTMANVTFTASPILPKGDISNMVDASGVPDSSGYIPDSSRTVQTKTTDVNGAASFSGLADGYYLIHQVTTVGGIRTIQDFIVSVNTADSNAIAVNVYPKLSLTPYNDLQKIALTDADDNFNGSTPDQLVGSKKKAGTSQEINAITSSTGSLETGNAGNITTAGSGNTVTWNLNSIFDASQVTNVNGASADTTGTYAVIDTLPVGVTYTESLSALTVSVADASGAVVGSLTAASDYTTAVSGKQVTVTLTKAGQLKVAGLLGNKTGQINIQLPTTVDADYVGTAENSVLTNVVNAFGADISNSAAKTAAVNVGGVELEKINSTRQALSGATFVLVRAKDAEAAKALIIANADKIKNDGSVKGLTDNPTAEFVKDGSGTIISRTTSTDGLAAWTGLNLVDNNTDKTNSSNYYAVEIKAPAGYDLPSPLTAANVTSVTADTTVAPGESKIVNNKPFNLPFTGGTGIVVILVIAAAAGITAFLIRRKKDEETEEISK